METRDGREIQMSRPARVSRAWGGGRSGKTKQQGFTAKGFTAKGLPPPPTSSHQVDCNHPSPDSPPSPSIPLNIAGELINRTLPRLGQGYLDALVRSCVKEAGTGCVSKTSKVAGSWSESGNEKQESWRRREPLGGGHGQDRSPKTTAPPDLVVKFVSQE